MTDLKDLKELAEAATGDAWKTFDGRRVETEKRHEVSGVPIDICDVEEGVDAFFIAAANPKTILELIARVEAVEASNGELEREAQSHYNLYRAAMSELNRSCAALSQAKAREGELRSALAPFAKAAAEFDPSLAIGPADEYEDDEDAPFGVKVGDLRNAVTAMGGDDNG